MFIDDAFLRESFLQNPWRNPNWGGHIHRRLHNPCFSFSVFFSEEDYLLMILVLIRTWNINFHHIEQRPRHQVQQDISNILYRLIYSRNSLLHVRRFQMFHLMEWRVSYVCDNRCTDGEYLFKQIIVSKVTM
jgi:hypothetical protein